MLKEVCVVKVGLVTTTASLLVPTNGPEEPSLEIDEERLLKSEARFVERVDIWVPRAVTDDWTLPRAVEMPERELWIAELSADRSLLREVT